MLIYSKNDLNHTAGNPFLVLMSKRKTDFYFPLNAVIRILFLIEKAI
ncbi:hypothetical protein HNP36_003476 [Chryseobacterium shigense]|uniref:Uncharacterized protein n=1 Tax=Chryseobacterium shigense TaxID=297244 RepID=A0A841N686_9FLAO|nr:hypothetical protein [Chryseobacterium shigense]